MQFFLSALVCAASVAAFDTYGYYAHGCKGDQVGSYRPVEGNVCIKIHDTYSIRTGNMKSGDKLYLYKYAGCTGDAPYMGANSCLNSDSVNYIKAHYA